MKKNKKRKKTKKEDTIIKEQTEEQIILDVNPYKDEEKSRGDRND